MSMMNGYVAKHLYDPPVGYKKSGTPQAALLLNSVDYHQKVAYGQKSNSKLFLSGGFNYGVDSGQLKVFDN